MASLSSLLGGCVCEDECDLVSVNSQRIILDLMNLVFVIVFYSISLVVYLKKYGISENSYKRSDWISVLVAICCFLTGCAYLGDCSWEVISRSRKFDCSDWARDIGKVLIWMTLSVSLLKERSKFIKILVSVWWMLLFVFISVIDIENLVEKHGILVLELIEWVVSLLLLLCALRNGKELVNQQAHETLLDPLLGTRTQEGNTNQIQEPSFLSKLVFSWVNPLISLGYRKPLVLEDIPSLAPKDQALVAYKQFKMAWDSLQREKTSNGVNLVGRALQRVYYKEMVVVGIYALIRVVSVIIGPLLLYAFVNYSNCEIKNLQYGLLLVGCLIVVKVVESLSQRHFFFDAKRLGMRMRSALMVAVYEKQLKLSSLGRKRHSTGEVVNYIGVDAYRMGEFPMWVHVGWTSFVQLFLAIAVLFSVVGVGVLPGLVPLVLCGILNVPFAISLQKCQLQFMIAQDKRLRSTSEILNNMKIIKLQSWEEKFKGFIESCRENEFKWLSESQYKKAYGSVLYWMSPTIISSAVLFGCVFFNNAPLNAATIFTILATLRTMSEPVKYFPQALSILIQTKVSFDRINSFLIENELKNDMIENQEQDSFGTCIRIHQGNFSWDPESSFPILRNINIEVTRGHKVAICGPVGAGKSSLLYSILHEITRTSGTVDVFGSIAYVSQASWIQSGTIRDNILYGKLMDEIRYENAINSCALDKDIIDFNHGDLTEIGQRGLNMSGGQKQRIQLARAVYNDADIYLLDDPFSAVDAHTAQTLFNDCVMTALREKTVILVTHQVEFLSEVDNILVMEDGQITQSGKYKDLITAGTAFEQLVNAHKNVITDLEFSSYENKNKSKTSSVKERNSLNCRNEINEEISKTSVQLTTEEEKSIDDVGWKPFLDYIIISKGGWFFFSSLLTQIAFSALQAAASYWLAFAVKIPNFTSFTLIGVYALISTTSAFFVFMRALSTTLLGLKASKTFFSKFTESIFSAPMLFFDSTPVGRILTRASTDLSVLDFDIPFSFAFVVTSGLELLTIITVMASVTWQVLIVGTFAIIATKYFQGYYQPSARELIRINGTTKAPVVNYASETSLGVATIRAFKKEVSFFKNYLKLVDIDARAFIFTNATLEWLVLRAEALQNLTLFTAAFFLVLLPKGYIDPGLVGLSFSYALALTNAHVFLTRWYCSLSNYIISVERIKQYMQIPPEPPAVVENNRPLSSWPSKGRIELHDLKIRYRPNAPLVLKGITCTFKEGTRVGIVGRTGSGKTTLITALFRLVEPDTGWIHIDGLDICSIGLKDLRMKLSVIPQEPTLFKGSIRTNLDPLGLHSDDEIWKALEKCQLKSTISSLPNCLDSSVSDEGENWSMGQRQLFCLGRVLLRRNKILVLDEATASIDSDTDAIVQRIIRQEFSSCTVVTVAHRIPTVIDSDMVMVLSFGKMMEYDEPSKLMESDSCFSKLVTEYWSSCRSTSAPK